MNKPTATELWLYANQPIIKLELRNQQASDEQAPRRIVLIATSYNGAVRRITWQWPHPNWELHPSSGSLMALSGPAHANASARMRFLKQHTADIQSYAKLGKRLRKATADF